MNVFARQACRPLFDSVTMVAMFFPAASRQAATTVVWSVTRTPLSRHMSSQTSFMYSGS